MEWKRASDPEHGLAALVARRVSGWYWVLRPRSLGRHHYDTGGGILAMIYIAVDGGLVSPLADLRKATAEELVCFDASTGKRYDTWLAGPVRPGSITGAMRTRLVDDELVVQVTGEEPRTPGWWWCRTNPEAPLLLVDEAAIGPVFLDKDADAVVRVFLATDRDGHSIDVGEFGFSEPLASRGGVIDESGELGRIEAEFHGQIPAPPRLPTDFPEI